MHFLSAAGSLDLEDAGDALLVKVDAPGFSAEQLSAELDGNILTIAGSVSEAEEQNREGLLVRERRSRAFSRCLQLPETVKADEISTTLEAGVLTIRLPKSEVPAAHKIAIGTGTKSVSET